MIKVMIVEDEPLTAKALATLICKSEEPFEICKLAENGNEALNFLKQEKVDVIFTDVRMPIMDGIELLKNINEQKMDVFTVIISGYNEFEYARQALRYQVLDYILKPLSKSNLNSVLKKIRIKYEQKNRERVEKILSSAKTVKEEIYSGKCFMAMINLGSLVTTTDDLLLPGASQEYQRILEKELNLWSQNDESVMLLQGSTSVEKILITESFNPEFSGLHKIEQYYENILKQIDLPITMVTHKSGIAINSIGIMKKELKTILYKRAVFSKSNLFFKDEKQTDIPKKVYGSWLNKLQDCIFSRNGEKFQDELKKYLEYCDVEDMTQYSLDHQIQILLECYCEYYMDKVNQDYTEFEISTHTYQQLYDELIDTFELVIDENDTVRNESNLGSEIKKYIEEHYTENLTNENLSKKFGFVSSYLGRIFKKDYGITIGNYILHLRMEKAKELLKEKVRVKEVAIQIGYTDPYYFSKVFKKNIGYWPSDFN